MREPELRIGYQLIINDPVREANWLSIDNQFVPPWRRRKLGSSEEIRDEFQHFFLTKESSIESALAENIFRIIQWNLLKPKNSKTILKVVDFHKKKIQESTEICGSAAQKNTFSKIIRQRKSSNWMRQIGSMLRELLLTFFNFLNPEFEHKLEGWKFTMTDRSLYLS